jgi:hypothetical protein
MLRTSSVSTTTLPEYPTSYPIWGMTSLLAPATMTTVAVA